MLHSGVEFLTGPMIKKQSEHRSCGEQYDDISKAALGDLYFACRCALFCRVRSCGGAYNTIIGFRCAHNVWS